MRFVRTPKLAGMPNECPRCKGKDRLIGSLLTYVVEDCIDTYEKLKEDYGSQHPETKAMSDLLTELAVILNKKTLK